MKILRVVMLSFVTWLLWLVISQYFFCAHFYEQDPTPFAGTNLFNPYDSISSEKWVKCNFHAHAKAWNGVTNGHDHAASIHKAYSALKYGIHCVSNYHYIDSTNSQDKGFIAAYEHGYNVNKTHQLVLGSNKVVWLDYLFPQTFHNKQHILKNLYDPEAVIILNHPEIRQGYTDQDFASLSNYDCMEVLNPSATSTRAWDAALSAGKKVFIVGNDDIHNLNEKERLGKMCTFVNIPQNDGAMVLKALKSGKSYGAIIGKTQDLDSVPVLNYVRTNNDTVTIEVSQTAGKVTISGQNGNRIASYTTTNKVSFHIKPSDHYARATFEYDNGTTIFLNPVFFTPQSGYRETSVYENYGQTAVFRILGLILLSLWVFLLWSMATGQIAGRNLKGLLSVK